MQTLTIDINQFKKAHWTEQETANVEVVIDFVQHIMNNHDFDYIESTFGSQPYKQHNRSMLDGIQGVLASVKQFSKRFPDFTYDVKHIFVDGDHVILHSHATAKKKDRGNDTKGMNIMDNWRLENGQLVEHWDAVQPLDRGMRLFVFLNGGKIRNENGVF